MENLIKKHLNILEQEKGVEILLACETGSRAWGFPSIDSDYDIRLIYKHDLNWYLSLIEEKDAFDIFLENKKLDICGWDLRKSLRLLWKSNPPLLERIQSPIVYKTDRNFLTNINSIAPEFYSRLTALHHYLSIAKKYFAKIENSPGFSLKNFFYALRTSIACLWILEKEELPPIRFPTLINELKIPSDLKARIEELIKFKATTCEKHMHQGEKDLFEFICYCMSRGTDEACLLKGSNGQLKDLNRLFTKTLGC